MQGKKGIVAVALLLVAVLGVAGVAYGVLGNTAPANAPAANITANTTNTAGTSNVPGGTNKDATSENAGAEATNENTGAETDEATRAEATDAGSPDANDAASAGALKLADFSVKDRNGNSVKLSSVYGKPALVGFWATWCPPCNAEAPELQKLFETYGDRINFMMIDSASDGRDTAETAYAWADEGGYTYPIYVDETGEATTAGQIYYLPTMYVLDAEGNVLTAFSGAMDETSGQQLIEQLLAL